MKSFVEKYKPKASKEIPQQLENLKKLIKNKEHVLLAGPTGSCKTIAVYLIAKELDCEIIEMNASDFRSKDQIESVMGFASKQQSLFQKEKILLIDEIDCLSGTEDRGGALAIANIIKESKFPIILTANDPYNQKIKEIKKLTELIEFKPITNLQITNILKNICIKENIKYSDPTLNIIITNCSGDLRAAINELHSCIINNELKPINDPRDYELSIIHILSKVLKTKSFENNKLLENTQLDLNEYALWLDENIPLEYTNETDLFNAYEILAKADIFKGRIYKWQYWRLMYYQSLMLSSGISISKKFENNTFTSFKRPMRLLKIWQSNMKNAKKKSIAQKIALNTHTSTKEIIKNFRYYKTLLKNNKIIEELKLDEDEKEYIKNQ